MAPPTIIDFEEGWCSMKDEIARMERILEGEPEPELNSKDFTNLYTIVYNMAVQKPPNDHSEKLYDKYREIVEDYCNKTVLTSLRKKHDENLLEELVLRWSNHKRLLNWLYRCFRYIDRYFVHRKSVPMLEEVGPTCFRDLVYNKMRVKATELMIALIQKARDGEEIDKTVLEKAAEMYVEIGMGQIDTYVEDFETFMLQVTISYYSRKGSSWIQECSCPEYMLKVEDCLNTEREIAYYLHPITKPRLAKILKNELLIGVAKQLMEDEHSGCRALLRNGKMDDLSRMFRLYQYIPQGLELMIELFKQHVDTECKGISKQFRDAEITHEVISKQLEDAAITHEVNYLVLIEKANDVYDNNMDFVRDCFNNHPLFAKALKEEFDTFTKDITKIMIPTTERPSPGK